VTWTPDVVRGSSVGSAGPTMVFLQGTDGNDGAVVIGWEADSVNPVGIDGEVAVRLARSKVTLQV